MNSTAVRSLVRRARFADVEAIQELATVIQGMPHWSRADYDAYCVAGELGNTQAKAMFVASVESQAERIVAFAAFSAVPHLGGGECTLENIAVAEPWRRQGTALRLLAAGLLWCRAWCPATAPDTSLWLEVRASNRGAIGFYENAGFVVTGRRPSYYEQPEEDAILMSRPLDAPLRTC